MPDDAGLAAGIRTVLDECTLSGTIHVAAWRRDADQDRILVHARQSVPAASTIKVLILAATLSEIASGRFALDQRAPLPDRRVGGSGVLRALPAVRVLTLADLLTLMIVVSDNTATNMVIEMVGMDLLNRFCVELGARETTIRRFMMDFAARRRGLENTTSALDLATLFDRLAWGDLLPTDLRGFALRTLAEQQFNDGLPSLLPDEAIVAHKTGELPGVRHDVGIVTGPSGRQAVVAVMTSELSGPVASRDASNVIAAVGAAAWHVIGR